MVLKLDDNENHLRDFNKNQKHMDAQVHSVKVGFIWTWTFDLERFRDYLYSHKMESATLHLITAKCHQAIALLGSVKPKRIIYVHHHPDSAFRASKTSTFFSSQLRDDFTVSPTYTHPSLRNYTI